MTLEFGCIIKVLIHTGQLLLITLAVLSSILQLMVVLQPYTTTDSKLCTITTHCRGVIHMKFLE